MSSQLPAQSIHMLSAKSLTMPFRGASGSLGSAYAPLGSKYPTLPGIDRALDHTPVLRRCSRL